MGKAKRSARGMKKRALRAAKKAKRSAHGMKKRARRAAKKAKRVAHGKKMRARRAHRKAKRAAHVKKMKARRAKKVKAVRGASHNHRKPSTRTKRVKHVHRRAVRGASHNHRRTRVIRKYKRSSKAIRMRRHHAKLRRHAAYKQKMESRRR